MSDLDGVFGRTAASRQLFVGCGVVVLGWMLFGGLAVVGTLWLFFFSGRQLRMTDDYAAISSAALFGLLVLLLVEQHLQLKKALELLEKQRESGKDVAHIDQRLLDRSRSTVMFYLTVVIMSGALVLTCLWASVDHHGPARWLAWLTWMSICWGFTLVATGAYAKATDDYQRVIQAQERLADRETWWLHVTCPKCNADSSKLCKVEGPDGAVIGDRPEPHAERDIAGRADFYKRYEPDRPAPPYTVN